MKTIYVKINPKEYPDCPLRSDLNSCRANRKSNYNECPSLNEDGEWCVPVWCPLLHGCVCIREEVTE